MTCTEMSIRTVSQCYGKQIAASCPSGHVIRILTASYQQSAECISSTETFSTAAATTGLLRTGPPWGTTECNREVPGNPACIASRSCSFVASWVQISAECGNSNQYLMKYQCVPS